MQLEVSSPCQLVESFRCLQVRAPPFKYCISHPFDHLSKYANVLCAALAVLLDFLLQVTAFVALIVFDFLRAEDNRVDCFPCIRVSGSNSELEKGINLYFSFMEYCALLFYAYSIII